MVRLSCRSHGKQYTKISHSICFTSASKFLLIYVLFFLSGDEDEEDDDSGDDDDDDDGGMSFMDMINANEAKVSAPGAVEGGSGGGVEKSAKAAVKGKGNEKMLKKLKGSGRGGSTGTPGDETRTSPPSADASSGSEEEFSEKAEESSGDDDNEDPMDFVSSDDSEDDDDDEDQRHAKLLGFVGALGEKTAASDRAAEDRRASQLLQEGEFNATTAGGGGSAAHSGVSRNGGITMEVYFFVHMWRKNYPQGFACAFVYMYFIFKWQNRLTFLYECVFSKCKCG